MTPTSIGHMLSGVRLTPTLTDMEHSSMGRSMLQVLPWEAHPRKEILRLAKGAASLSLANKVLTDVTGALRLDRIGGHVGSEYNKGVYVDKATDTLKWVSAPASISDCFVRVLDDGTDSQTSSLIGAICDAKTYAAGVSDKDQLQVLTEFLGLIGSAIAAIQPGTRALPGVRSGPNHYSKQVL